MGIKLDAGKIAEVAKKVVAGVRKRAEKDKLVGWAGVKKCVPWVVREVEKAADEVGLFASEKQEVAVQAILVLVPDRWVPDWLIEPFVRWAIDAAVEAMKKDAAK